jgi:hypothetical protein
LGRRGYCTYLKDIKTSNKSSRVQVLESIILEIDYSNKLPISWCPAIVVHVSLGYEMTVIHDAHCRTSYIHKHKKGVKSEQVSY